MTSVSSVSRLNTRKTSSRKSRVLLALLAGISLGVNDAAHAAGATHILNTSGSTSWAGAAWLGAGAPDSTSAGDVVQYSAGASGTTTLDTPATIGVLVVTVGQTWTVASDGNPADFLTFDNTGGLVNTFGNTDAAIYNVTGTVTMTVNPNIVIANTDLDIGTIDQNSGTVTINGNITVGGTNSSQVLWLRNNGNAAGQSNVNIAGSIGISGSNISIQNVGTGGGTVVLSGSLGASVISVTENSTTSALTLSGSNVAYTGSTTLAAGTLNINSAAALGTGTFTITSGTIDNTSAGTVVLTTNQPTNWNGDFTFKGTKALTFGTGAVTMSGSRTITTNGATLTVGGGISGAGFGITKTGTGTLALTGSSTYTGATVVNAGVLVVGGSNGSIAATSGITASGSNAKLLLDSTAGNNATGRINGLGVNLSQGAELSVAGNATTNTTESMGTIAAGSGASIVTVSSTTGRVTTLAANAFTRSGNGTVLVRGTSLDQSVATNVSRITLADNGASLTLVGANTLNSGTAADATLGLVIVPYLIGDVSAAGSGSNFVTYDSTLGLRVLNGAGKEQVLLSAGYSTPATHDNVIAFNGTLTNSGPSVNSLLFNAAAVLNGSGVLTVDSGAVAQVTNTAGGISGFSSLLLGNGEGVVTVTQNTLTLNTPVNVTSGGGLTKSGTGTLVLAGSNLYTGATLINQGTLQIGNGAGGNLAGGSGDITVGLQGALTVSLVNGDTLANNIVDNTTASFINSSGTQTLSGNISGTGAVTQSNGGTTILSGSNSYTGITSILNGGKIAVSAISDTGTSGIGYATGTNAITFNSSTLELISGTSTTARGYSAAGTSTIQVDANASLTLNGTGIGGGGMQKSGAGVLALTGTTASIWNVLSGTLQLGRNITGPTIAGLSINGGVAQLTGTSGDQISSNGALTINSGTFDLNGQSEGLLTLSGTGGTVLNNGGGISTLTVGTGGNSTSAFSGSIVDHTTGSGTTALIINMGSAGLATLTGVDTYSGGTILQGSGFVSFGNGSLGSGPITFVTSTGLQWNGSNTQDISSQIGAGAGLLKFDVNGNTVVFGTAIGTGNTGGLTLTSSVAGGSLTLTGSQGYTGTTTVTSGTLKLAANSSIKSGNALTVGAAGTFDLAGNSDALGVVANSGNITNSGSAATITITNASTNSGTYSGNLSVIWNQGTATNSTVGGTFLNIGDITLRNNNGTGNSATFSGTLNNTGSVINAGSGGTAGTISGVISTNVQSVIQNSTTSQLTLTGSNTYTGPTIINRGTLQVGNGTIGSLNGTVGTGLVFNGNGTFIFDEAANTTQGMTSLSFNGGDGVVQSTFVGTNAALTFSGTETRAVGATGNFITSGGTNGVSNSINLTGQAAGFIDQGSFFGGSNYAWVNAAGTYVRGINWGVDAGSTTAAGGTSLASTAYAQTTGAVTAQNTATFTVLNIVNTANSAQAFTLGAGQVLTTNGILRSGNGGSSSTTTISGGVGAAVQSGSDKEMVIRTDLSNDLLTISAPIVANGNTPITKSGAGTLTLSGTNTFLGLITVNNGTLQISSDVNLGSSSNGLTLNGGTLKLSAGNLFLNRAINLGVSGGSLSDAGTMFAALGNISGTGALSISAGTVLLGGSNTFTGGVAWSNSAVKVAISSDANLGGTSTPLSWGGNGGVTVSVMGTAFNTFGNHPVTWGVPNNGGSIGTLEIQDPNNVFNFNQNDNYSMNSANPNLTITGQGTVRFTTAQSFTDTTGAFLIMNGGTTLVDQAAGGSLQPGGRMAFGGGTLYLLGKTNASVTQSESNIDNNGAAGSGIKAGGGTIVVDNNNGTGTTTLALGTIAAVDFATNGSSLDIYTKNLGSGTAVITTTTVNDATGIIGIGRTVYGTTDNADWATNLTNTSGSAIGAYTGYTAFTSSGASSAANYKLLGSGTVTASESMNTLKITGTTGGSTLGIVNGQTLTMTTGGILFTGSNNYSIGDGGSNNGTLVSNTATTSDLVISQYGSGTLTINSVIANGIGTSTLTKAGTGKLVLASNNTYTGATYVNGGILSVSAVGQLGATAASSINLNGGTLQVTTGFTTTHLIGLGGNAGTLDVGNGQTLTLNGIISGGGLNLTDSGNGTGMVVLGAANTFGSGIWINSGILQLNNAAAISQTGLNTLAFGSGTMAKLELNNFSSVVSDLVSSSTNAVIENATVSGTGATLTVLEAADTTFAGVLRDGTEDVAGSKSLSLVKNGGLTLTLTGSNTYTGTTTITGGVLQLGDGTAGHDGSLSSSSSITNNAALAFNTFSSQTYGGSVSGTGTVTKSGSGTLLLTGSSNYTGATRVNAGVMKVNGQLGNTTVTVGNVSVSGQAPTLGGGIGNANGGVLQSLIGSATSQIYGSSLTTGFIAGNVVISGTSAGGSAGHLAPGNSVGTMTVGTLALSGGSILDYEFNGSANDFTMVTTSGGLTINGGGFNLYQEGGTNAYASNGVYDLIGYTGSLNGTGIGALSVLNQQAGKVYTFGTAVSGGTNYITLTISGSVATTSTTYSLTSTATTTKIFTSGSTSISSVITNTGTGLADTLDYTGLGGSATGGSVSGSTTSGTGLANGGGSGTNSGQTYVAGTTSGTFVMNPVGTGTNHTLGTAATLSGSTPVSVSVYDQASLTTSTTTGNQATPANLILTNGTSTGGASGQRAGVTVTGLSASNVQATDNTNNFATPVTTGSAVADAHGTTTSATVGTASVLGKRLNGTYTETITGTTRYTDNTLNGQQSVANQTWNITATVSGNASTSRSDVYTANVLSGKAYGTSNSSGFSLGSNLTGSGHQATTATLLNSSLTASATTNANMSFDKTAANAVANSFRSSDILTLSGLNSTSPISGVQLTDVYVLQLSYDTTATGVQYLGWNNGSQFVNAISGDSTGNTTPYLDGNEVVGAYSGQTTVGTYGYDPTNHVVWAVLNHGGFTNGSGTLIAGTNEFAAIPEPSTWGMILGGFGMLMGFQKLRKRRVGI